MAAKVTFESQTCGRCGGSGSYSYCQMYGSTCFKCGGAKKHLSKAGAKARAAFAAKRMELAGVPVEALQPGQKFLVKESGKWATVVSVTHEPPFQTSSGATTHYVMVRTLHSAKGFLPGDTVIVSNPAVWPTLVEFAKTLKGAVVVEQPVTA